MPLTPLKCVLKLMYIWALPQKKSLDQQHPYGAEPETWLLGSVAVVPAQIR
jgi:hypothetical protein